MGKINFRKLANDPKVVYSRSDVEGMAMGDLVELINTDEWEKYVTVEAYIYIANLKRDHLPDPKREAYIDQCLSAVPTLSGVDESALRDLFGADYDDAQKDIEAMHGSKLETYETTNPCAELIVKGRSFFLKNIRPQ